uniref:Uncharacterized protein n=1 Tax=viral metagenome TaxID=1070528 RepID=A0A6C0IEX8_9ZZZZ
MKNSRCFNLKILLQFKVSMKIVIKNNNRVLEQHDTNDLIINDGDIIMYTGIYYKKIFDIVDIAEVRTQFIGKIATYRADTTGITGIYIEPLYIWDNRNGDWCKIVDYKYPTTKYFLYPHLLMLPETDYHYKPIYTLHTCKNCDLDNYKDITKTFCLHNS